VSRAANATLRASRDAAPAATSPMTRAERLHGPGARGDFVDMRAERPARRATGGDFARRDSGAPFALEGRTSFSMNGNQTGSRCSRARRGELAA